MAKYIYNEQLIKDLGYYNLIDKYQLDNNRVNEAIFYAVAAIDSHIRNIIKVDAENILLGDYFSFEYYSLLKDNLDELQKLTTILEENYNALAMDELYGNDILFLSLSLPTLLCSFYNKELYFEDALEIIDNFTLKYKEELCILAVEESRLSNLLLHLELLYAR